MSLNFAQRELLTAHGLTEIPAAGVGQSDLRLLVANAAAIPDPAPPEVNHTPAAAQWLGDRDPDKLDAENKVLFDHLNTAEVFRRKDAPAAPAERAFNQKLLANSGLTPEQRMDVQNGLDILAKARAEADSPVKTVSEHDIAWAKLIVGPYLE